jgi:ribosomal protein L7Ae-like RNA K-turn-binding protein
LRRGTAKLVVYAADVEPKDDGKNIFHFYARRKSSMQKKLIVDKK